MSDNKVRVMILLMIKNESKIIKRSIDSTLPFADAVFIEDTGSTDNTVEVANEHFKTLSVPGKITQHPFKNFGYSRSHSFTSAQEFCKELGWNPAKTYALAMDADMNLVVSPAFDKETLSLSGYQLIQANGGMEYLNMRLMRLSDPWKCVGATHEYWSCPQNQISGDISKERLYIDDKNDGGCKSDKFTRDLSLLLEELKEKPKNDRTHFYLAQTYRCLNQFEKSNEYYKKRIALGGWFEEVWYSYYMIVENFLSLNLPEKAELWAQKAYKYNPYRSEALYRIIKHFRLQPRDQWKAVHYYKLAKNIPKPKVALFLESNVYDYELDYEYTILQYYVNPVRREGNIESIKYMMKPKQTMTENVFQNMEFYVEPLPNHFEHKPLNAPDFDEYKASSPSATRLPDGRILMNVRYVNYETSRQGEYTARDPEGQVRTRNAYFYYKQPYQQLTSQDLTFLDHTPPQDLTVYPTRVHGFEDVRLISFQDKLYYTSASSEFSPNFRVVFGEYDLEQNKHLNNRVLQPPTHTDCEKNWLAVTHMPKLHFIYSWCPFRAGPLPDAPNNKLEITITHNTPQYFSKLRGSTNAVLYNDSLYVLTHSVKYGSPRKYYNHIVKLDKDSLQPKEISNAFAFEELGIEYCLTMLIENDRVEFVYSHFDSNPKIVNVPLSEFTFISV
jgi:glycosyltransferase involved in cell wall biosynthesis